MPIRDWKTALNRFSILFGDRMPVYWNQKKIKAIYTKLFTGDRRTMKSQGATLELQNQLARQGGAAPVRSMAISPMTAKITKLEASDFPAQRSVDE